MPGFELFEARHVNEPYVTSAADALSVNSPTCPNGKLWFVTAGTFYPSVAESRTVLVSIFSTRAGTQYPIVNPSVIALSPTMRAPIVPAGQEVLLFPGEYLIARRDVATAGSSILIAIHYVELDLPMYQYRDVQHPTLRRGRMSMPPTIGGGGAPTRMDDRPAGGHSMPGRDPSGEPI